MAIQGLLLYFVLDEHLQLHFFRKGEGEAVLCSHILIEQQWDHILVLNSMLRAHLYACDDAAVN